MTFNYTNGSNVRKKTFAKGNSTPSTRTIAAEVVEVVPGKHNEGYIVAKRKDTGYMDGQTVHIKIQDEEYERMSKTVKTSKEFKFFGGFIDEKMKEALSKKKTVIVAQNTQIVATKNVDGEKIPVLAASFIRNVTHPQASKFFRTTVSASGYYSKERGEYIVSNIQAWEEQAVSIEDKAAISKWAKKLDELKAEYEESLELPQNELPKNGRPIPYGFVVMVRGKNPEYVAGSTEAKSRYPYRTFNQSPCYDYITEAKTIVSGDLLKEICENYKAYVEAQEWSKQIEDLFIEVAFYKNYKASTKGKTFVLKESQTGSPLYQMINTDTGLGLLSPEDEGIVVRGKNWGGDAYIALSPNKKEEGEDENGEPTITSYPVNFVVEVYPTSSYRTNVLSYIKTHHEVEEAEGSANLNRADIDISMYRVSNTNGMSVNNAHNDDGVPTDEDIGSTGQQTTTIKANDVTPTEPPPELGDDNDVPF